MLSIFLIYVSPILYILFFSILLFLFNLFWSKNDQESVHKDLDTSTMIKYIYRALAVIIYLYFTSNVVTPDYIVFTRFCITNNEQFCGPYRSSTLRANFIGSPFISLDIFFISSRSFFCEVS